MTTIQRYEGIQSVLKRCGNDGCHFLTLLSIAEQYRNLHMNKPEIDLIYAIRICRSKNWISPDFYVNNDGTPILEFFTCKKWTRKEVDKLPVIGDNDYTEAIYYNPSTQLHHYRRRGYDTLEYSKTVTEGSVEKYYIYTVEAA